MTSSSSTKLKLLTVLTAVDSLDYEQTKHLVIRLGLDLKVIKDIETDYKGSSNSRKIHTIQAWLDRDTEASWEKIVHELEHIGMKVIARQVAELHCPSLVTATTTPTIDADQSAIVHPPQPVTDTLTPLTPPPTMLSHIATTPVIDSAQSHNLPSNATPTTPAVITSVDLQSPPTSDHSQPIALPTSHSTSPSSNTTSTTQAAMLKVNLPSVTSQTLFWSQKDVKAAIEELKELFLNLTTDAEEEIAQQDGSDGKFLRKFRKFIQLLPVAKKAPHVKFFQKSRKEIIAAENTDIILAILCTHIDYRNCEILFHLITRFCSVPLQENMKKYRLSLETFEKHTTVDIYIGAVPDEISKEIEDGFSQMVVKINKPSSVCTLFEVRKLNETIVTKSGLESHCVYLSGVTKNCVVVAIRFPSSVVGWILAAMTPYFIHTQHLTEITMDEKQLTIIQETRKELVCNM